jgi:hypothetical protein
MEAGRRDCGVGILTQTIVEFVQLNLYFMSNKTRSVLKGIAVVLALLAVVMQLHWVIVPSISEYRFWFVVIAFGLLLISSK